MKKQTSPALRLSVLATMLAISAAAHSAPNANASERAKAVVGSHAAGRILVMPKAGLPEADFDIILKSARGARKQKVGQSTLHIVKLDAGVSEQEMVDRLSKNPHIKFAELDKLVPASAIPNDPYYGSSYHLPLVGAPAAWDTTQGEGVTIAILDSGVNGNHPDLAARMVPGYNFYDNNTDTSDVQGHGTAVAGVAAAATNNSIGVAGVAGQAKIMPVRIADANAWAYYSTIAQGITWAADHGAKIANASYGGVSSSSAIINAANYLRSKGGVLFVSAGNTGAVDSAPMTNSMVVVSATNAWDSRPSWSTYGNVVTLSAPGEYIYTTNREGGYGQWNGTSFSSPLVAGVGALMLSANPALTPAKVDSILYTTAKDIGDPGRDIYYGYGRVDAAAAVAAAVAARPVVDTTAPVASIANPVAGASVSGVTNVDVTASDNVGVAYVQLKVNGTVVATDNTAPYTFSWDTKGAQNGNTNLEAVAFDAAGNSASSGVVAVNVSNYVAPVITDTTAPALTITNPTAGVVSGNVTVSTSASDDSGAAGISQTLYVDGVKVAYGTGSTLSYNWNTRKTTTGAHSITAVATDKAGNTTTVSVAVSR